MTKKSPQVPVHHRPLSKARQTAFLEALAICGVVAEASRIASPHAANVRGARGSFYSLRRRDPNFAAAWDAAQEQADAALLTEARRRAVTGSQKGVFQKGVRVIDHDGEPATETVYSDRLMEILLKSRFPNDFVERRQVEHVKRAEGWRITGEDLLALSEHETEQLMAIMAVVMEARGEIHPDPGIEDAEFVEVTPATGETLRELETLEAE